ncbi:hypothetical protein CDCA_CDCA11G3326 [Cyanidium caldarium]|uniref:Uncharacterized protein n=1 Tax=Cyanidium caldarium TaxID=2771 RepID=A0AAV9IYT7_CYACA|nr:hypothetical protein CDCA_CDCA11G3326 [Cyanidium caldarium]
MPAPPTDVSATSHSGGGGRGRRAGDSSGHAGANGRWPPRPPPDALPSPVAHGLRPPAAAPTGSGSGAVVGPPVNVGQPSVSLPPAVTGLAPPERAEAGPPWGAPSAAHPPPFGNPYPPPLPPGMPPGQRRVTGVMTLADIEAGLKEMSARPPEAPSPGASSSPAPANLWFSERRASLMGARASTSAAAVVTATGAYTDAFPSLSAAMRVVPAGNITMETEAAEPQARGHRRVMKPHEVELIRYLHERSMRASGDATYQVVESFYATALRASIGETAAPTGVRHLEHRPADAPRTDAAAAHPMSSRRRAAPDAKSLATALGAVPKWTPRAPRRILDVNQSVAERGPATDIESGSPSGSISPSPSMAPLREDARIEVRARIEAAYDAWHHWRALQTEKDEPAARQQLVGLLGLAEESDAGQLVSAARTNQAFHSVCTVLKGRKLVGRVLPHLSASERYRALQLLFGKLAVHTSAEADPTVDATAALPFWQALEHGVQEVDQAPALTRLLEAFVREHQRSRVAFRVALSSEQGARLLHAWFLRAFRMYCGPADMVNSSTELDPAASSAITSFSQLLMRHLGDVFDIAGPPAAHEVWALLALLDSLLPPREQATLHGQLRDLIHEGRVPQPGAQPETTPAW